MTNALVIYSGGLDSTALLYWALSRYPAGVSTITFDYGQRHLQRELAAARDIIEHLQSDGAAVEAFEQYIDLGLLRGNALTGDVAVPSGSYSEMTNRVTVVPNRNAIMLSIAAAIAADRGIAHVLTGVHAGDHAIYPDCRPAFIAAFNDMLALSFDAGLPRVLAPFLAYDKAAIVLTGTEMGAPLSRTWSCYRGETLQCGTCPTCIERREAFQTAGIKDDTVYMTGDA